MSIFYSFHFPLPISFITYKSVKKIMEKLVRRGDPALLEEWLERYGPDPEFADILDGIVAERKKKQIR
jgi:hypothetical protein